MTAFFKAFPREQLGRCAARAALVLSASFALIFAITACQGDPKAPTPSADAAPPIDMAPWMGPEGDAMLGEAPRTSPRSGTPFWTIALATFANDPVAARDLLEQVRTKAALPEARLDRRGKTYVVAYGRYRDAGQSEARADLTRLRSIVVDGELPFASATLLAPAAADSASTFDEFNLGTVKARVGERDAVYTLQVNVYGRPDKQKPSEEERKDFRAAAEEAVKKLRADGDEAYYYHGPNMSMVTVGVFGPADYDERRPLVADSPRLKAAREKFPHNLLNGMGVRIRNQGQSEATLQRSTLVAIPDE